MGDVEIVSLIVALMLCVWAMARERRIRKEMQAGQLPPGPRPWPLAGNIFQLGLSPHKTFAQLALVHGPVMTLRLGAMTTVVISSGPAAQEMFRAHDAAFAGRTVYEAMNLSSGNEGSIITAQLGPRWRMLRRLCAARLFSCASLDALAGVRAACVDALALRVEDAGGRPVDIGRLLFFMTFGHVGQLTLSRDLLGEGSEVGAKFFHHAGRIMELAGKPNVADFVPALRALDPQGIRWRMEFHVGRALDIVAGFVKERMEGRTSEEGSGETDLLDVLLEFEGDGGEEPAKLSPKSITTTIFEMFAAGTDTSASTMEWAMAELLRHPETMHKVQAELRAACSDRKPEERDVVNLPYLNAVIKETLRLHPPLPLLVPHKSTMPCTMLGYHIPQDAQILVNVWGIGRDPQSWNEPNLFKPERFLEASFMDFKDHHFKFIPFGSGRRMCPAVPLMSRMLPLVLGTMLHSFDWALPGGMDPEKMDMNERMGITLRKAVPLSVIATPL